jgi:hypothetical protein
MGDRRLRRELSIVALVCTLGIFLCPSSSGPYSSVHGPVTALRAIRIATDVVQAFQLVPSKTASTGLKLAFEHRPPAQKRARIVPDLPHDLILRC